MIKHLIKSIISDNIALTVCATICLALSTFVILYELSFSYKVTAYNFDSTYVVDTDNMPFADAKSKTDSVGTKDFDNILYSAGNGVAFGKIDYGITKGRRPLNAGEVIASNALGCAPGATVHYGGNEYTVVGIAYLNGYEILIDYDLNDCSAFGISEIVLIASVKASRAAIADKLGAAFQGCNISIPKKIGIIDALTTTPVFILAIVIILLSVCTYSLCVNYLLKKTYKPATVYLFLGFPADKLIIRLFLFVLSAITACFAICGGIFAVAEHIVAAKGTAFMSNVVLSFGDYMTVYAVMIFLSAVMLLPAVIDVSKKSVRYKYV